MKSIHERQELKKYGGELISFAPTAAMKFGLSDEHIRADNITAHVEVHDAGSRVTATRVVAIGVFSLAAKKKRPNAVTLILRGNDYARVIECDRRENAEKFAARVNAITAVVPAQDATTPRRHRARQTRSSKSAGSVSCGTRGRLPARSSTRRKAELLRRI